MKERLDGLAVRINEAYRRLEEALGDRELMLLIGELLSEAEAECPEGEWSAWLEENFPGSVETARDFLALHRAQEHRLS